MAFSERQSGKCVFVPSVIKVRGWAIPISGVNKFAVPQFFCDFQKFFLSVKAIVALEDWIARAVFFLKIASENADASRSQEIRHLPDKFIVVLDML